MNAELNELQKEVTRQRILENGFRVFSERTIEKVKMTDVAAEGGIGVATVYRYFPTKTSLVLAISAWAWEKQLSKEVQKLDTQEMTAAEEFGFFLESILELYRSNRALLRFNQFFNVYIENESGISAENMRPYLAVVDVLSVRFDALYRKAQQDGTLRTDLTAEEIMLTSLHLMLAATTRYAVGLIYEKGSDPEKELVLLKNMLLREYTQSGIAKGGDG